MARQVEARLTLASDATDQAARWVAWFTDELLAAEVAEELTAWEVRVVDDVDVET